MPLTFGALAYTAHFCNLISRARNKTIWRSLYDKNESDLTDNEVKFLRKMSMGRLGWSASTKTLSDTPLYDVNEYIKRPVYRYALVHSIDMLGVPQVNRGNLAGTCTPSTSNNNCEVKLPGTKVVMPLGSPGQTCKTFSYRDRKKDEVNFEAAEFLAANQVVLDILKDCRNHITVLTKDLVAVRTECTVKGILYETQLLIPVTYINWVYQRAWHISAGGKSIKGEIVCCPLMYAVNSSEKGNRLQFHTEVYKDVNGQDSIPPNTDDIIYEIDHKNGDRSDSRPSNLRLVTREGNQRNRGSTSGKSYQQVALSGVSWFVNKKDQQSWIVTNYVNSKQKHAYFIIPRDGSTKREALINALRFRLEFMKDKNSVNGMRDLGVTKDNMKDFTVEELVEMVIARYDNAVENDE